jgi:uncharacterized membrane protein (DUF485 family)
LVADFYPAYASIKTYREGADQSDSSGKREITQLKFWQKYWTVRSVLLLGDYLLWPFLQDYEVFWLAKLGTYVAIGYFGMAELIFESVIAPIYSEFEPYVDVLVQHTALSELLLSWRGGLYKFFVQDLEDFLVPN